MTKTVSHNDLPTVLPRFRRCNFRLCPADLASPEIYRRGEFATHLKPVLSLVHNAEIEPPKAQFFFLHIFFCWDFGAAKSMFGSERGTGFRCQLGRIYICNYSHLIAPPSSQGSGALLRRATG